MYGTEESPRLLDFNEAINTQKNETAPISEIRLLSINKVSRMLGIRYETVRKLVRTGRIKAVTVENNKCKIPYKSLTEFVNESTNTPVRLNGIISLEETQKQIDEIFKEYSS